MSKYLSVIFCGVFLVHAGTAADFNRDIRPILSDKCFACHGFDEKERKADLRLDTREGAFADLGGYAALVPGDLEKSEAWYRIITEDEDDLMPPPKMHKPLTAREKELIKEWIEEGAEYRTHWSYAPLQKGEDQGAATGIDFFIGQQIDKAGVKAAPKADRITLARRLHFDLLGLPPTPAQVEKFVGDSSPDAYEKLVDGLLADPAFGERMAVYWLDLVRYADTIGYHSDNFMEVSAYREYVIDAFNRNISYDQFTIEQLAGDLLPNPTLQQRIASGYNRLLQTTEEGGAQAAEYMVIHAADRVRNVSGVWLGSTIGCAQCHDHKYDPFSMRDFYSLAAFFADVKREADRETAAEPEASHRRGKETDRGVGETTEGTRHRSRLEARYGTRRQGGSRPAQVGAGNPGPDFGAGERSLVGGEAGVDGVAGQANPDPATR